jgi:membrane-associated phospholipid phosphatase
MLNTSLSDFDISILRLIHHHRIEAVDQVLYYFSFSATFVSIGILLTVLAVSIKKRSKPLRVVFYKMLTVFLVAAAISLTLKTIIPRERPFITYPDIEKLSEAGNSSFPSGHSIEAFAMAVALSILIPKRKYFIPVFAWATLVAYSRMALGVHYPSDVMGGIIIGSLIGWLIPLLFNITKPVR